MDKAEISKLRNKIFEYLDNRQLALALKHLRTMVDSTTQWDMKEELNRLDTSFGFMLQYLSKGVLDPQRDTILSQILVDSYQLTDKTVIALAASQSTHLFYQRHSQYKNQDLQLLIDQYVEKLDKLRIQEEAADWTSDSILRECEAKESDIFNKIWSSYPISHGDVEAVNMLLTNSQLPSHLKSLVLSALMLGLTKFFDREKFKVLIESYVTHSMILNSS